MSSHNHSENKNDVAFHNGLYNLGIYFMQHLLGDITWGRQEDLRNLSYNLNLHSSATKLDAEAFSLTGVHI